MADGHLLLAVGALLAAGLGVSLLAGRLRLPGLVLVLGLGMAVGSDGVGWVSLDDYELARRVGVIALALILFEGGLAAGWPEVRPVIWPSLALALPGTLLTALVTGLAAALLFDFSLLESLLVGSILATTDAAAIFGILRGSTLRRRVARTLEGEAGFNDPVAVLLVLGFVDWIEQPGYGLADMVGLFLRQLAVGGAVGLATGWLAVQAFRRARLATSGLYPVVSIASAALAYGAADTLHGSGFLAVYMTGLALGGHRIPARRTVAAFHDGLAWLAQLALFFTLGVLVFPSQLGSVAAESVALALALVLVSRPLAAFLVTLPARFTNAERVVLGWAGLRGAVPVVLATFPVIDQVPHSVDFFNIAFFVVLVSTVLQGVVFEPLARTLGVTTSEPALPRPLAESGTIRRLGAEVLEFPVGPGDAIVGRRVRELGLPREAVVNVIVRGSEAIPPRGSTAIEAGDQLHVLVRSEFASELDDLQRRWREGPIGYAAGERRPPRGHPSVFSTRRWRDGDGDPGRPRELGGVHVIEHLRTRRDQRGALVLLEDGRYAVTGPVLAVGGRQALQQYARRRIALARDDSQRGWWQEVVGALAR
ncbi:MAG: potassium/proton antiporter [Thermoleophilaceae bacterium]|nr:potassium/proton antiporter [Thermoleophilaceae bacterium]